MLNQIIRPLTILGKLYLFGSSVAPSTRHCSDIDIGLIPLEDDNDSCLERVHDILKATGHQKEFYVQRLLAYERHSFRRKSYQYLHLLICEKSELSKKHPLIQSFANRYSVGS